MSVATNVQPLGPAQLGLARVGDDALVVGETLAIGLVGDEPCVRRHGRIDQCAVDREHGTEEAEKNRQYVTSLDAARAPRKQGDRLHGFLPRSVAAFWNRVVRSVP